MGSPGVAENFATAVKKNRGKIRKSRFYIAVLFIRTNILRATATHHKLFIQY